MSDQTRDDLRKRFDSFDKDGNGAIDEDEFASLVRTLRLRLTPEQTQVAFSAIDVNGNQRIDYGEFVAWWTRMST